MGNSIIETTYPLSFRGEDAKELGEHLKHLHSVVLIGMKRVGINNFLRFFLHHKGIPKAYLNDGKNHLFIFVDLHDLVELEIFPFWTLTFKRIADAVETSPIDLKTKKEIEDLFMHSIQLQDLFMTIDSIRKSLVKMVEKNVLPVIFFDRFDRIKDVVTEEFYGNLQGLKDASNHKLSYVFTSFRSLDSLSPKVFTKASLSVFCRNMYIKPAKKEDMKVIYKIFKKKYNLKIPEKKEKELFDLADGYVQYLHLALIHLSERKEILNNSTDLFEEFVKDERIILQSEELWENLTKEEQGVLLKVSDSQEITEAEKDKAKYLWDTGFVIGEKRKNKIFSPLFQDYLKKKENSSFDFEFTKKENLLFNFLKEKKDQICEREDIVSAVWPEVESLGVSDWAIDRLVARVRQKLKSKKNGLEIQTIKTRGYKLISS